MVSRNQYSAWILGVQDVIEALPRTGLANVTDVVVSYDDTSKRVTVRCAKVIVLELREDIAFGYLNNTAIRASDKKVSSLPFPKLEINIVVSVLPTVTVKGEH